jgi:hypothetical protein
VGEKFPPQYIDWQNVNVKPMGGDGFDEPMVEKTMCDLLGILVMLKKNLPLWI